ncbi:hypothetical protein IW262DRAFT_1448874 [Armillaria fumosa]|nr:hypothetical protein IW262DRAFT_1448874 [Armillaria fumosa]
MPCRVRQTKERLLCFFNNCLAQFKSTQGHSQHINAIHAMTINSFSPSTAMQILPTNGDSNSSDDDDESIDRPKLGDYHDQDMDEPGSYTAESPLLSPQAKKHFHSHLTGIPCDEHGIDLPQDAPPPSQPLPDNLFEPFKDEVQFCLANFLFCKVQMLQGSIDELLQIWVLSQKDHDTFGPFANYKELYAEIDAIKLGDAPWKCLIVQAESNLPPDAPSWKCQEYQIWYRDPDTVISNMLANTDFAQEFDTTPYVHVDADGCQRWCDFISGNYAWRHLVWCFSLGTGIMQSSSDNLQTQIYRSNPNTKGAMYVGIIVGADKTTVLVGTSHVEYHLLYISIENIHNSVWHAHQNGVIPISFLAIPKSNHKYDNNASFHLFKKQLYHQSIAAIFESLKPVITTPIQVYLSGIIGGWCPKCVLTSFPKADNSSRCMQECTQVLLEEYSGLDMLWFNFGIDENILPFTWFFPHADIHEMLTPDLLYQIIKGTFKNYLVDWVGEYLVITEGDKCASEILDVIDQRIAAMPAFSGLHCFSHGHCFKQWTDDDSKALMKVYLPAIADYFPEPIIQCLTSFLDFCYLVCHSDITETTLAKINMAVSCFHQYREAFIECVDFGAPNGVCSSITESWHITAMKKPWQHSNRNNTMSQMLLTNQHLDKLHVLHGFLANKRLIAPNHPPLPDPFDLDNEDAGAIDGPVLAEVTLAHTRGILSLLATHVHEPALPDWLQRFLYDQLHQDTDPSADEISIKQCPDITSKVYVYHSAVTSFCAPSMGIVQIKMFLSFMHGGVDYPCVLVHWFKKVTRDRDLKMGMWIIQPEQKYDWPVVSVVHLDSLFCGAHLTPVFGLHAVLLNFHYSSLLDCFTVF